jgi:hypothetical protein
VAFLVSKLPFKNTEVFVVIQIDTLNFCVGTAISCRSLANILLSNSGQKFALKMEAV